MVWTAAGGAAIAALGSILGGMINSGLSYSENKRLIGMQQNWQERMSNTAHQREVADLRAAGLNPILSATGGSGASFGSASAPSVSSDIGIADAVNSALNYKRFKNETKLNDSQVDLMHAQEFQSARQASLLGEQARNEAERFQNVIFERNQIKQNIENSKRITDAQVYNLLKNADASMLNASANSARAVADVKYTNERSRGYSDSHTESFGGFSLHGTHSRGRTW